MDWLRLLRRAAVVVVLVAALAWPADYAVWTLRGAPTATVDVTRFVVAPLKGSKEEYYPDGTATLPCSQSLFPQSATPCWYLQRNRVAYDR